LLEVHDLAVAFATPEGEVRAASQVSFSIEKGEVVALVGESGSGKTVTALSILQLLPYPTAHHPTGSIRVLGQEMVGAKEEVLRHIRGNHVAMVFQEPMTSLNPLHTIKKQIGEMLAIHKGMRGEAALARIIELLEMVGLREAKSRLQAYPHQLSGGQRQRVMIAMALAADPDMLIADEPTTALDVTVQAQILALLKDLQTRLGMGLLLITHDLGIVRKIANKVLVLTEGRIVEQGAVEEVFERPSHPYTKTLLAAEPRGRAAVRTDHAAEVMTAKNLKVWFPIRRGLMRRTVGHIKAVDSIDLRVREGHTLGVVGESGSGKTTLGLALLRLEHSEGEIHFAGRPIQGIHTKALRPLRREMQIVFQDPFSSLNPRLSIGQTIGEGLRVHRLIGTAKELRERIEQALVEVGLDPACADRYPHEFSGGQRQRIAIARAMVLNPRFVVLDEPTSSLDVSVQAQIIELLKKLQARHNLAYLFISHDLRVVRALADEIIVMKDGRVVEQGPAEQVFERPQEPYTKALMAAALRLEVEEPGLIAD
jgi:microcin C transport system ATP-binding protein